MKLTRNISLISVAVLLLSLAFSGCGGKDVVKPKSFFIAPTGYLRGEIEPCKCPGNPLGGFPRRATKMHLMLRWPDGTLKVDTGNFVSLARDESEPHTEITLAALNKMGTQAINLGLRDLRIGLPFLHEMKLTYQLPFTSANVLDAETNKPAFDTYRIVHLKTETGPLDVAVIGLAMGAEGRYLPPEWGVAIADPPTALREALDKVAGRVGAVVLLTDADRRTVSEWMTKTDSADEISTVISANLSPSRSTFATIDDVTYTTTGQQGKFFDLIELKPRGDGFWTMDKQGWPLNEGVEDDAEMVSFLDEMQSKLGVNEEGGHLR